MRGYAGRILNVDLTLRKIRIEPLTEVFCRKYIGGVGFAIKLLLDNTVPKVEPLSDDNVLVFSTGPFTATIVPSSGKHAIASKSPLSGFIGTSITSGRWSQALRQAGYDSIVISGRAEEPVYLFIDDEVVSFKSARNLWGKGYYETDRLIKEEIGDETVATLCIGPAGENLVRFACIMSGYGNAAGRCGLGAVMGFKKLKAIAIRGTRTVEVKNLDKLMEVCLDIYERCQGPAVEEYRVLGSTVEAVFNQLGGLPIRNWQSSSETVFEELSQWHYFIKTFACPSCPVACKHIFEVKNGTFKGAIASIGYGSLYALGLECGITYFPSIIKAVELCNHYGMDTASTGVVIGWAMECHERGLHISKEDDENQLTFGNYESLIRIIHKIAYRDGIGNVLAEGVKRASEIVGKGSEYFAMHIKGLELPGYDIRGLKTAALGFSVVAEGACHSRSYVYELYLQEGSKLREKDHGKLVADSEDLAAVFDSLILCRFIRKVFNDFYSEAANLYSLITGMEMSAAGLKTAGERIINIKKLFNIREGWTRKDDHLPQRFMREPMKGMIISQEELEMLLDQYYEARGWTKDGIPTVSKLTELRLSNLIEKISEVGGS